MNKTNVPLEWYVMIHEQKKLHDWKNEDKLKIQFLKPKPH